MKTLDELKALRDEWEGEACDFDEKLASGEIPEHNNMYAKAVIELHTALSDAIQQIEELRDGIRLALDVISHGDFKNGITGPNGIIDEGEVHAGRMAKRLESLLGGDDVPPG